MEENFEDLKKEMKKDLKRYNDELDKTKLELKEMEEFHEKFHEYINKNPSSFYNSEDETIKNMYDKHNEDFDKRTKAKEKIEHLTIQIKGVQFYIDRLEK